MLLLVGSVHAATVTLGASGGNGRVDLNWTASEPLAGVQVYRDTDASPAGRQRVAILPGSARSYTDRAVANGTTYWYWIKYADAARSVGNSNTGSPTPTATSPAPFRTPTVSAMAGCTERSRSVQANEWQRADCQNASGPVEMPLLLSRDCAGKFHRPMKSSLSPVPIVPD